MSDWEEWAIEWSAWMSWIGGAEVEEEKEREIPVELWGVDCRPDWGDRVPEFMDGEL